MMDRMELDAQAKELRATLGEDAISPIDVFALVSQIDKLTLVVYPMGERISGMCIREDEAKVIAVNSTMSYGRQRFSLAHELYHLYYDEHQGFSVCAKQFDPARETEKAADQFASYFLAPYQTLYSMVRRKKTETGRLTLRDIISLEQYFGMSHSAMLWRLVGDRYLTSEEADSMRVGVIAAAKSYGFDESLYCPTNKDHQQRTYGHYIEQAEELLKREAISTGKYEELMLDAFRSDIVYGGDETEGEPLD